MLKFDEVYVLRTEDENYMPVPQLAFGAKQVQRVISEEEPARNAIEFLVPNEVNLGHVIFFSYLSTEEDGVVVVVDAQRYEDNTRSPVVWRFIPLDEDGWESMRTYISGYDELNKECPTIKDIKEYYIHQWLDNGWYKQT